MKKETESDIFIYLLTLFNIDHRTLAPYALIKIDYFTLGAVLWSQELLY